MLSKEFFLRISISFLLLVLTAEAVFAAPLPKLPEHLQSVFTALAKVDTNYKTEGVVCEQLARLQLKSKYPENEYAITTGVEYSVDERIVGELDLVIYRRSTHQVVVLGEVKCWKSLDGAMDKAKEQRDRFLWTLSQRRKEIVFKSKEKNEQFAEQDFSSPAEYIFVSQTGGKKWGFTEELPYRLSELEILQVNLISCQKKGSCRPD